MRATSARVVSGFARIALETSTTSTSTSAAVAAVSSRALASTSTVSRAHGLDAFVDANRDEKSMARIKHVLTERAIEEAGGDEKKLFEMMRLINAK